MGMTDLAGIVRDPPPGVDELVALGEVLRLARSTGDSNPNTGHALSGSRSGCYDRVVIDTAPTGHTLRLLSAPDFLDAFLGKRWITACVSGRSSLSLAALPLQGSACIGGDPPLSLLFLRAGLETPLRPGKLVALKSKLGGFLGLSAGFLGLDVPKLTAKLDAAATALEVHRSGVVGLRALFRDPVRVSRPF